MARGRRGVEWFVVVDGKPGPAFASVGEPLVGPKGRHIAYTATHELKTAVVVNGRVVAEGFDWAGRLGFDTRGTRLGFAAMKDGNTDWMVTSLE
ncbi:MAG: hypothetical protein D6806_03000 [Deltaproteobacteria bacterium]|nr:MAG: hypothetical protein D6806_03000 [Deltaproteobacteria bacterium]